MIASSLLVAAFAAGTSVNVNISFLLDGEQLHGTGVVIDSDSGKTSLFAEARVPSRGVLAMIEIVRGDETTMFYREIFEDRMVFGSSQTTGWVRLPSARGDWSLGGAFEFTATRTDETHLIEDGVIVLVNPTSPEPRPGPRPDPGPTVIVGETHYHDTGCGGTTTTDDPTYESSGGCEGDTVDDPDDYESSGGCEGDTVDDPDSGDYETMSSGGGCEGDSADEGSSSCEGDGVDTGDSGDWSTMQTSMMFQGLFRLGWPIALAGGFNRWWRRKRKL